MSEIKPALTAEEWARYLPIASSKDVFGIGDTAHRAAALALYGHPKGFTWDDVEWLRAVAVYGRFVRDGESGFVLAAECLADRIAALLPPREG